MKYDLNGCELIYIAVNMLCRSILSKEIKMKMKCRVTMSLFHFMKKYNKFVSILRLEYNRLE